MKYIIAGFLFHLFFTVNLIVILLCLNAVTIDDQRNTTSWFAEVILPMLPDVITMPVLDIAERYSVLK